MGHAAAPDRCDRALRRSSDHRARRNQSLMDQLKHLIEVWTSYAQGLTGSIGALAFVCASLPRISETARMTVSILPGGTSTIPNTPAQAGVGETVTIIPDSWSRSTSIRS